MSRATVASLWKKYEKQLSLYEWEMGKSRTDVEFSKKESKICEARNAQVAAVNEQRREESRLNGYYTCESNGLSCSWKYEDVILL